MAKRKDAPTRGEVTEKVETNKREMEVKETDLDKIVSDVETVRHTIENLDFEGTAEGNDEVENSIKGAEEVTKEVFSVEDEKLEQLQNKNEEIEGEIRDRSRSSESDLGKISSAKVETKETINELEKTREAVLHDLDFLKEQILRASEGKKQSDDVQKRLQDRVHTNQGGR